MVLDVEDVINSGERAEQQSETFETDELYDSSQTIKRS